MVTFCEIYVTLGQAEVAIVNLTLVASGSYYEDF